MIFQRRLTVCHASQTSSYKCQRWVFAIRDEKLQCTCKFILCTFLTLCFDWFLLFFCVYWSGQRTFYFLLLIKETFLYQLYTWQCCSCQDLRARPFWKILINYLSKRKQILLSLRYPPFECVCAIFFSVVFNFNVLAMPRQMVAILEQGVCSLPIKQCVHQVWNQSLIIALKRHTVHVSLVFLIKDSVWRKN